MADGTQHHFRFPKPRAHTSQLRPGEIVVDLFAGGGGASEALLQALGRDPTTGQLTNGYAYTTPEARHD